MEGGDAVNLTGGRASNVAAAVRFLVERTKGGGLANRLRAAFAKK